MANEPSPESSVRDQSAESARDRTPRAAQTDRPEDDERTEPGSHAADDESSETQEQRHGNTESRADQPPKDTGRNDPVDENANSSESDDEDAARTKPSDENKTRTGPDDERDTRDEPDDEDERGRAGDRAVQRSDRESGPLLEELVAYLRESRTEMREEWARRIADAELLGVMSDDEIFSEATEVYDNYVDALETGSVESLEAYARELSERIIPRGVETSEVLGIVLLLRDVLARALFTKYDGDQEQLNRVLDAYEPAANRIAVVVGVSFVEERERVISEQQQALRELSTPVLQFRERLLILPIIGALDSSRARQLTEQLLGAIQEKRARVVVIDITGVATVDRAVANHLVQTVEASRLMGASTILTGISSEIAQTLVDLGVDLGMMRTVGDLQGGLVEAERLAGYHSGEIEPATRTEI
ncbi:MAG: STAS domain-containing protein [Solirubrobacteraceae bacterium]